MSGMRLRFRRDPSTPGWTTVGLHPAGTGIRVTCGHEDGYQVLNPEAVRADGVVVADLGCCLRRKRIRLVGWEGRVVA